MSARLMFCAFSISGLLVVSGCSSKTTTTKKSTQPAGPPVQMVVDYMQKLIPNLEPKLDAVEGLGNQFQTQITKKDANGMTMVSINHKGRYNSNGPVVDMTITFRRDHLPANQEELLRYTDGLMRAAGYSPDEARRIAETTWNMPNPQKDGNALNRIYLQGGDYLAVVDGRQNDPPYVNIRTVPKGMAK